MPILSAKKIKAPKKPKKKRAEPEIVTPAKGMSLEELKIEEALKTFSYDPIELTYKIMEFGKLLTGIPLYGYQYKMAFRIIYALVRFEGAVLTCLLARQSGKSEGMAFAIDTVAVIFPALAKIFPEMEQFKDGVKIGVFAPQADQVFTTTSRALMRISSENASMIMADPDLEVELESEVRIVLSNGSYCKAQVASKQSKIESKTYDLVIMEEAQDIDNMLANKSILPMVTATGGTIVKVGTTGTTKNHYWQDIQYNRNLDRKVTDDRLYNHWEFDYVKVIKDRREQFLKDGKNYHLHYEKSVLQIKDRQGADSIEFKLGYALVWDLESGMLITDKDWARITNKKRGFAEALADDTVVAGLDIAKDRASTVITVGRVVEDENGGPAKKELMAWIELQGINYDVQHIVIMETLIEYGIKRIMCDYTGVGKPVVDRLMAACSDGYVEVIPYEFSRPSKSEMWYRFLSDINNGRLMIPATKKVRELPEFQHFEEQMMNCQKYFDASYLVCEKLPGYHDDYVDSCALMTLAADYVGAEQYEVEQSDNPFYEQTLAARENYYNNSL